MLKLSVQVLMVNADLDHKKPNFIGVCCTAGNDFMFTPIVLMFSEAVDCQCVNVTILDDSQREREKSSSV